MGRSKEISLKKYLRENGNYLTVPKWLIPVMGLDTAVFLCALIEIANTREDAADADSVRMPVHCKKIHRIYGISEHRQRIIMQILHDCRMMQMTGERNKYRNQIVRFRLRYCEILLTMLKELKEDDKRKVFFEQLQTSKEQRTAVQDRLKQENLEREQTAFIQERLERCRDCPLLESYLASKRLACGGCPENVKRNPNCRGCLQHRELVSQLFQECQACPDLVREEEAA